MKKNVFEICLAIFCIGLIIQIVLMTKKVDFTLSLIFGPLLYLAYQDQLGKSLRITQVISHFIPFLLVTVLFFLIYHSNPKIYRHVYFVTTLISMFIYPSIVIFSKRKSRSVLNERNLLLLEVLAILGFAIFFFLNIIYINLLSNNFANFQSQLVIVAIMLINVGVLSWFLLTNKFADKKEIGPKEMKPSQGDLQISSQEIIDIHKKVNHLMDGSKIYLDAHLTIDRFAKQTGISKDVAEYFINQVLQTNYEDWLATYRIKYAIDLIHSNTGSLKLEYLANLSGFNSRTSFNRYFKHYVGESPSNYRSKLMR